MKHIQDRFASGQSETRRASTRSAYLTWFIWVIWLPFMVPAITDLWQAHPPLSRLILTLTGAAMFILIYLWGAWKTAHSIIAGKVPRGRDEIFPWIITIVLVTLSGALALSGRANQWLSPCIFTSAYIGGSLRPTRAVLAVAVLVLLILLLRGMVEVSWIEFLQAEVFLLAVCFISIMVVRAIKTSQELRAAREEIAKLAVVAERLRIARDLHDLLGHNLSLITLKSELAGRLLILAPERAQAEIQDIEQVARTTLREVRVAVASYRQPTLANELHAAQEILTAAGIHCICEEHTGFHMSKLPTLVESVLAWTVREGVTNVIRHGRARQCVISLWCERSAASIKIRNDGESVAIVSALHNESEGNGLRGLAERAEALEGYCDAGPLANGGYCLAVTLPLKRGWR